MGNSADRIISQEAHDLQMWISNNDQESLRAYIMKNKLRLSEQLEDGFSILEHAVTYN